MKCGHGIERVCPICGKTYTDYPAVSREDSSVLICPDCGTRQALVTIGVTDTEEQDRIIGIIHSVKQQ